MASRRLFRQLFDKESSTYTYLLADMVARQAILIDPVIEQAERDVGLVRQLGLNLQFVLNTHVHADHITGTGRLKRLLPNTKSVISKASGAKADILVSEGDTVRFGEEEVAVVATPGHTEGCVTYVHSKVFLQLCLVCTLNLTFDTSRAASPVSIHRCHMVIVSTYLFQL